MAGVLDITAVLGGREVSRAEVLEWEGRRAAVVYKKVGMGAPPEDVAAGREALVAKKLELGHAEIERRLAAGLVHLPRRERGRPDLDARRPELPGAVGGVRPRPPRRPARRRPPPPVPR